VKNHRLREGRGGTGTRFLVRTGKKTQALEVKGKKYGAIYGLGKFIGTGGRKHGGVGPPEGSRGRRRCKGDPGIRSDHAI